MTTKAKRQEGETNRLKALSHPLRAAALRYLNTHGTGSPGQIADALEEDLTNISYHIRRLVSLGCIELVTTESVRGTVRHIYRPVQGHLVERGEWDELPDAAKKINIIQSAEPVFDDFRAALEGGTIGTDEHFALVRLPMRGMDREGLRELTEICERAFHEAEGVPARCLERRNDSGEEAIKVSFSVLAFEVPSF